MSVWQRRKCVPDPARPRSFSAPSVNYKVQVLDRVRVDQDRASVRGRSECGDNEGRYQHCRNDPALDYRSRPGCSGELLSQRPSQPLLPVAAHLGPDIKD